MDSVHDCSRHHSLLIAALTDRFRTMVHSIFYIFVRSRTHNAILLLRLIAAQDAWLFGLVA